MCEQDGCARTVYEFVPGFNKLEELDFDSIISYNGKKQVVIQKGNSFGTARIDGAGDIELMSAKINDYDVEMGKFRRCNISFITPNNSKYREYRDFLEGKL